MGLGVGKGYGSFVAGGSGNTIYGNYGFATGYNNEVSGETAASFGDGNIVSGYGGFIGGFGNVNSGDMSFGWGRENSIGGYADFVAGGGDLYVPTPEEKAAFKSAAAPVYDWFKANVDGGEEVFDALTSAVAAAEAELNSGRASDIN